jgi:hypothetical protein
MARGSAPNLFLPPNRALTQQRDYRARKAADSVPGEDEQLVRRGGEELEKGTRRGQGRERKGWRR